MSRRAFAQRLAVSVPVLVALSSVANDVDAQQAGQQDPPPPTPGPHYYVIWRVLLGDLAPVLFR